MGGRWECEVGGVGATSVATASRHEGGARARQLGHPIFPWMACVLDASMVPPPRMYQGRINICFKTPVVAPAPINVAYIRLAASYGPASPSEGGGAAYNVDLRARH